MTNVEALTKLARVIGIPMPTETTVKSAEYLLSEGNKFTEVIEATLVQMQINQSLTKISDFAPSKEEIENATNAQFIFSNGEGSDDSVFTYGDGDNDYKVTECNGGCLHYISAGIVYWVSVCEDGFSASGAVEIAEAPSKGFYINTNSLEQLYARFVLENEKEVSMGATIADVINYMADNYPIATA